MVAGNVTEGGCWDERAATQRGTGSTNDVYVVNHRPKNVLHSYTALEVLWIRACMRINGACVAAKVCNLLGVTSRREEEQSPKCCR